MVKECSKPTNGDFCIVQAFYVGIFGVRYRTAEGKRVLWPNQYVWLLQRGFVRWEDHAAWGLDKQMIEDKSKADFFVKAFALAQAAYFVIQGMLRTAHNLPLAPFESMTMAYIPLFVLTYFFWWVKPKDIETPSLVDLPKMAAEQMQELRDLAVSNAFDDEGTPEQTSLWNIWTLTPRVFEKVKQDQEAANCGQRAAQQARDRFERMQHDGRASLRRAAPLGQGPKPQKVLASWDPDLYHSRVLWPIIVLFGTSFGALHLISWDGVFPTTIELWLWRAATIASMVTLLVFMHFKRVVVNWSDPLISVKLLSPALYLLSRLAMLVEAVAAFRAASPAIYETFVLSNYWHDFS